MKNPYHSLPTTLLHMSGYLGSEEGGLEGIAGGDLSLLGRSSLLAALLLGYKEVSE